jgi:hypothetical protein
MFAQKIATDSPTRVDGKSLGEGHAQIAKANMFL